MTTSGKNTAPGLPSKPVAAVKNCACSFEGQLEKGVFLTGTPTVTATPSGLTISLQSTNAVGKEIENRMVPPRKAATWSAAGGTDKTTYKFTISCASTASETLVGYSYLRVENT